MISRSVRFAVVSFLKTLLIFLIATGLSPSIAEHTTPYEPQPTNFWIAYRWSTVKSVPRTDALTLPSAAGAARSEVTAILRELRGAEAEDWACRQSVPQRSAQKADTQVVPRILCILY